MRTGDLGYVDASGLVHVVDRVKDLVIVAGENVACAEVEMVVAESDWFTEVAVIGVPDARLGERLVAIVTPRPDRPTPTTDAVQELVRGRLASYKVPSEVIADLGPLPRGATGKVLKRTLREMYWGRA